MKKLSALLLVVFTLFILSGATCQQNLQEAAQVMVCGDDAATVAEYAQKFNDLTAFSDYLAAMPYSAWIAAARAGIASALTIYEQLKEGQCVTESQAAAAAQVLTKAKNLARSLNYRGFK